MNPVVFFLLLLLIGLTTGWIIGAALSFTGGDRRIDLAAGLAGSVLAGLPLHLMGPAGYRETLPALLVGVSAAMLATWWSRILTWKPEPVLRQPDTASNVMHERLTHDVMTTGEGTALLLRNGMLSVPDDEREIARWQSRIPLSSAADAAEQETGTVRWFDPATGHGVVVRDEGGAECFLQQSSIVPKDLPLIEDGARVAFDVLEDFGGPLTANVRRL